jgi:hypothetical protein
MEDQLDQLMNEHRAAEILGLSVQTLRNDRSLSQGLPYIKLVKRGTRGTIRYRLSDMLKYIESHLIRPGEDARHE